MIPLSRYVIRMSTFTETFPGLSNASGVRRWDTSELDELAASGDLDYGVLCAGQFVFSI